jgi:hypothetical protein
MMVLLLLGGVMTGVALAQEKKVKDQVEYDLFTAATKETDPNKKIQHLLTWKEKYPDSDFKNDRLVLMIQTYQALRQGDKMWETTQELLKNEPKNLTALYYLTILTPSLNNTAPDRLEAGEKAANGLIAILPESKPPNVAPEVWAAEAKKMEILGRKTLAWVATARKNWPRVEEILTTLLKMNPNSGQVSYQLGTAMVQQKDIKKQIPAMYHFARAAYYEGEEALAPDVKKQVQAYFEKVYVKFHGSNDGMQEIIELTKKSPFPPEGFTIKSEQEIIAEGEEKMKAEDPQKYLWVQVKKGLIAPDGLTYFESIKGSAMPKLKGKVVSSTPAARPKEVTVSISTNDTPEIKLRIDTAMPGKIDPGTEIEFESAVPQEFSPDPFLVTADIEKGQITGWPAAAPPAKKTSSKKGKK